LVIELVLACSFCSLHISREPAIGMGVFLFYFAVMNEHARLDLLSTRKHYDILDGLRGVAAIAVVIFHFMEIAVPDYHKSFIAHAYLAVDFFFCLSGFVIAYAYDGKLQDIGRAAFFKLRLIRLHPLVVIGSVWGLIAFVFDPFNNLWLKYSEKLALLFVTSCFMVPYAVVRERYFNNFHLNPPVWSLFWEYVANIVYAFVLIRMHRGVLWILVAIGAVALFCEAAYAGNLSVGWSGDNFWGGGVRAFFAFTAGVLVYRSRFIVHSKVGFLVMGVLLLISFLVPYYDDYNKIIEPAIIVFYYPLLLALGSGTIAGPRVHRLCELAGEISYPLYMIHYPFIWIFMSWVETHKPSLQQMIGVTAVGTVFLIVLSYAVLKYVDAPVRQALKNRLSGR